jgi:hypothetical protein
VWCGVVWCGVVWCGVVWCGVVWCGVVWGSAASSFGILEVRFLLRSSFSHTGIQDLLGRRVVLHRRHASERLQSVHLDDSPELVLLAVVPVGCRAELVECMQVSLCMLAAVQHPLGRGTFRRPAVRVRMAAPSAGRVVATGSRWAATPTMCRASCAKCRGLPTSEEARVQQLQVQPCCNRAMRARLSALRWFLC